MRDTSWRVVLGTLVTFTVGFIGGCAPTHPAELLETATAELSICGNGACDDGESCASCPGDCGRCTQAHCGDGTCGRKESCVTCAQDCGACPGCGNKVCDASETCASCSADCGRCGAEFCGNGTCGRRESCTACARDCCPVVTPDCEIDTDCPGPVTECAAPLCDNGACTTSFAPAGTPSAMQVSGDCTQLECDGAGNLVDAVDDLDLPADDGNECTQGVCVMGLPQHQPAAEGTSCTGGQCDDTGTCTGCASAAECPASMDACLLTTCVSGICGFGYVPQGASPQQVQGDCSVFICDGMGNTNTENSGGDVPDDGNECTEDFCQMGSGNNEPEPAGTPCMQNGGTQCDGLGNCITP